MAKKLYDLAVKTGTKPDGKGRFKNIGVVMDGGEKGLYMLLDRTFNPAGVLTDRESLIVSMFRPREEESQAQSIVSDDASIPF